MERLSQWQDANSWSTQHGYYFVANTKKPSCSPNTTWSETNWLHKLSHSIESHHPVSTGHSLSKAQVAQCDTADAEWSGPSCTSSNTVGRNQSLACLDPPFSPQSLRNCGARSDKPLICWLRECRRAMLRWWQHVYWGGGGPCWLNTSLPGSHVNCSVSRPLSHGRPFNRKCCSPPKNEGSDSPIHMILCMLAVALVWGRRHAYSMPWERSVSFQIRGQDCFYSLPLVWPHSQEQLHVPEPTPPCSPLTVRLDRAVGASVCAHACAQLCVLVCVSEWAWILLQFDPTQIFLKEKQRRGGRLCGQRTRPAKPLHSSQWNLYL